MKEADARSPRDRILATAKELFTRRGIADVGIDEVIDKACVAKGTLYRHFPSKVDLVLSFLQQREQEWTVGVIDQAPRERSDDPEQQLLAIFDILDEWFRSRSDYEAFSFVHLLFETRGEGRIGEACIAQLDKIRAILRSRAEKAGLRDPTGFAWAFNTLLKGSIVNAAEGDAEAALRAKPMGQWLIQQHRRRGTGKVSRG